MVYIMDKNRYKTLKEISLEYNVPLRWVQMRYNRGIRDIKTLTTPHHLLLKEKKNG